MEFEILSATKEDLKFCEELCKEKEVLWPGWWYYDIDAMECYLWEDCFLVAKYDNNVIWVIFWDQVKRQYKKDIWFIVWTLNVNKNFRWKWIWSLLLKELEKRQKSRWISRIYLLTHKVNENAIKFYSKNWYTIGEDSVEVEKYL